MAHVHKDGIHPWVNEGLAAPPAFNVHDEIHDSQQEERETAHTGDIRQRPKVFIDRYKSFVSRALRKDGC